MSSTTRTPIKAKSLTLLELCQTITDLHYPTSRNTAQILTRRLYLHPLTINNYAKQYSSKLLPPHSHVPQDSEQFYQPNLPRLRRPQRDLTLLSSSYPLTARSLPKQHTSFRTGKHDKHPDHLPPISRGVPSSIKRTVSTRTSYLSHRRESNSLQETPLKKADVWHHLAQTLRRPIPKDPPTTPLDMLSDYHLENIQQQFPSPIDDDGEETPTMECED